MQEHSCFGLIPAGNEFAAYLRAIPILVAFAVLMVSASQGAEVMAVPQFIGTNSETWERFGVTRIPSGTSILGGIATISGDHIVTARVFPMCTVFGRPSDGTILMDSDRPTGPVIISFSQPVSAFGAYWGSGIDCWFGDAPSILTFEDANGNVIGSDSFFYGGNGILEWHGYRFAKPVKKIIRVAGDGKEGFATDGLQATVTSAAPLSNISTRGFVQTGNDVLIGGLIVTGSGQKRVLLRVLGPTLGQPPFNLSNAMANPRVDLFQGNTLFASNDNWGDAANKLEISATGVAPPNALESAILASLNPGSYTAIVRGVNNTTGLTLMEAYDVDAAASSRFGNTSTRGFVGTGADIMIAGLIVQAVENAIIRALGPTLTQFAVSRALADPILELRDANGNLLMTNDNWKDSQQAQIAASGYAPPSDLESAIAATLAPGNYTAILRGKNNTAGNALVEVYGLN